MRPVTDRHQISRPKLAYLIDATAAPVCMIAPISSWAAAVSSTAEDLDTGISGIQLFIRAIPYNFYSLLTFVFIITLTLLKFDYGPMRGFEERARNTGDLSGSAGSTEENANPKGRVIDLVIPVIMLIILCTIGMLYVGGFFGADTSGMHRYGRATSSVRSATRTRSSASPGAASSRWCSRSSTSSPAASSASARLWAASPRASRP